jgi:hypothetical protein
MEPQFCRRRNHRRGEKPLYFPASAIAAGTRMTRLAVAPVLLALFASAAGQASNPGNQTLKNFKLMDQCAKEAQQAFPDFTTEAQAKRDAKLKECLASKNLPPRGE